MRLDKIDEKDEHKKTTKDVKRHTQLNTLFKGEHGKLYGQMT